MFNVPIATLSADPSAPFPSLALARRLPNGLLAVGGDLSPTRLLNAYRHGVFPWYAEGEPIQWWSPNPRCIFTTNGITLSSRFRRSLRHSNWQVRADSDFESVINACATAIRPGQRGTWITRDMQAAYIALHQLGHAHSIEVYDGQTLVGGLYGVSIGQMFFGESMFSAKPGGSKIALAALAKYLTSRGWLWIDAQVGNSHTVSLGAKPMPRAAFIADVMPTCDLPAEPGHWRDAFGIIAVGTLI